MKRVLCTLALVVLAAAPLAAQTTKPLTVEPATKDFLIKEINIADTTPLNDFVDYLRDVTAGRLNITLIAPPGVKLPNMPAIKMKNVPPAVLLEVVPRIAPTLELDVIPIEATAGVPTYVITYRPDPGWVSPGTPTWRMFRLSDVFNTQYMRVNSSEKFKGGKPEDNQKEAMNQILSLVKAALALVPATEQPTLQVHAETSILLFKGTPEQGAVVETVLDTLRPLPQHPAAKEMEWQVESSRREAMVIQAKYQREVAELRAQISDQQKQLIDNATTIERLRVRLESGVKTTTPKE